MKLGIIVHIIPKNNIFILDVGWGQLRYFYADKDYKIKDIILYEEYDRDSIDSNEIKSVCCIDDCDYQGNIRYDEYTPRPSEANVIIARKDLFVYWKVCKNRWFIRRSRELTFDRTSNSLLFMCYVEPRYPLPNEKDFLKAYSDARKKVEELDIPKMIEELKVEEYHISWTRKGSDNVTYTHKYIHYNYSYYYDYLHDRYLDSIFPKYSEKLYDSKDGEYEYIHPKYQKTIYRKKMPDGSCGYIKAKFEGIDLKVYCENKTKELRQVALKNYENYNKDEHINSLAYSHIYSSKILKYNKENELILKMKGLAEIIWGFNYQELIEQINIDNYRNLIEDNNANHPVPYLPNQEE